MGREVLWLDTKHFTIFSPCFVQLPLVVERGPEIHVGYNKVRIDADRRAKFTHCFVEASLTAVQLYRLGALFKPIRVSHRFMWDFKPTAAPSRLRVFRCASPSARSAVYSLGSSPFVLRE